MVDLDRSPVSIPAGEVQKCITHPRKFLYDYGGWPYSCCYHWVLRLAAAHEFGIHVAQLDGRHGVFLTVKKTKL